MDGYLWLKALHVISIIAWMAGLLYLPRLFVYHTTVPVGSPASETFKVMERRLYRFIMNPAMIASWIFGVWLIVELWPGIATMGWLHLKLLLVVAMSAAHGIMGGWRRAFAEDRNRRSERFYRIANEVPTLLMIGIVILAIVKPF
jgi:putative membrane protein